VPDVVRIFAQIRKKIPARLVLVGDGPDRSTCEQIARELGVWGDVKFLGKQVELVCLLSSADLFLMPSQSESFGLSALEAMACNVPVISSSVGGLPELVSHGETGYIAEIGDIDRMAKYAVELLSNRKRYGVALIGCFSVRDQKPERDVGRRRLRRRLRTRARIRVRTWHERARFVEVLRLFRLLRRRRAKGKALDYGGIRQRVFPLKLSDLSQSLNQVHHAAFLGKHFCFQSQ